MASSATVSAPKKRKSFSEYFHSMRGQQLIVTLVFLFVPLVLLFMFTYLPFFKMVEFSFFKMKYIGRRTFVGLQNYISVFTRKDCFHALSLSLYYMAGSVVQMALALLFATILSFKCKGSKFFRGALYFPCLICGISVGFIFKFFFTHGFVLDTLLSWVGFNVDNFIIAWNKANMGKAFLNSFIILICVLAGSIMISAMLAYVLNRFKFPGNKLIRNLFTIATLIPGIASQVTVYQIMTALHLVNSMPGYIILMMGTDVITIYIFLQFFENLSPTLDESAILDGCTYFGVFFKILLPLLKPAIVTSAILKGVSTYNEYYMANLYLQDKTKYQVVATSLYVFSGPMGNQYNYICAGVIITIIPALIVFLLCQDQIYSGMAAGAVKG